MLNPSIQGTDKQGKSQLIQRNDTLTIFPYIKSTKNLNKYDKEEAPLLNRAS
jgi:hypothetical protein